MKRQIGHLFLSVLMLGAGTLLSPFASPAAAAVDTVTVERFDVSSGIQPQLLNGHFVLKNSSDAPLSNLRVRVQMEDENGHALAGAVVTAQPVGDNTDVPPGAEKTFNWAWYGSSGVRTFKAPQLDVTGASGGQAFDIQLKPSHPDVVVPYSYYRKY